MNRKKNFMWGVLLAVLALGILTAVLLPQVDLSGLSFWRWLLAIGGFAWLLGNLFFGKDLRTRLSVFFPLALMFIALEPILCPLMGRGETLGSANWLLLLAAAMLTAALYLFLGGRGKIKATARVSLSDSITYLDATDPEPQVLDNKMGDLKVFYQNTELVSPSARLRLQLDNKMGDLTVHVPEDWFVRCDIRTSLAETHIRPNAPVTVCTLEVSGDNKLGDVRIVSP